MKKQDIEELKAFCDEKGIEMIPTSDKDVWEFKSKDIWEGVEFAECIDDTDIGNDVTIGKVYKCSVYDDELHLIDDTGEEDGFIRYDENFKPSTESAYVEQLKSKAHELYGEIKDGDIFDASELGYKDTNIVDFMPEKGYKEGFDYEKQGDRLYYSNVLIYQQGKWAKKVGEEPIRVKVREITMYSSTKMQLTIYSKNHMPFSLESNEEFMNHIEESIESYLNAKSPSKNN